MDVCLKEMYLLLYMHLKFELKQFPFNARYLLPVYVVQNAHEEDCRIKISSNIMISMLVARISIPLRLH